MRSFVYLLFLLSLLVYGQAFAQGENNIWYFGAKTGLDFNNTPPSFAAHEMVTQEGCATVSDANGALLFYTMGSRMWDRNHNLMPGSVTLSGNGPVYNGMPFGSSATGAVVIESSNNDGKYFVFTLNAREESLTNLYYSVVDMNLNSGLGDIVPGQGSILLGSDYSEMMCAFKAADCHSFWLVARTKTAPQSYHAYKVDFNGVNTIPIISAGITSTSGIQGYITVAPDGVTTVMPADQGIEVATFNGSAGTFGNFMLLDNPSRSYYTAFSPDQSKLYLSGNSVIQYDFSLMPNISAVNSSAIRVGDSLKFNAIRLGPDNKLYLQRLTYLSSSPILEPPILSVINNPNLRGTDCDLDTSFMYLPTLASIPVFVGFGEPLLQHPPGDTFNSYQQIIACFQHNTLLVANNTNGSAYQWNNGATGYSLSVDQSGLYWVDYNVGCDRWIDTFDVSIVNFEVDLGNDTLICISDPLILNLGINDASYTWQDGSTSNTYTVNQAGTYYVTARIASCTSADTIVVHTEEPLSVFIDTQDTVLCKGEEMTLSAYSTPVSSTIGWNTGQTGNTVTINAPGTYTAAVSNSCGRVQDTVTIALIDFDLDLGNDTTICNGEVLVLNPGVNGAAYYWQDGSTADSYTVHNEGAYSVTATFGQCARSDTIYVSVQQLPVLEIIEDDTTICRGEKIILHGVHTGSPALTWNTGVRTDTIHVTQAGSYSISDTSMCGIVSDAITVSVKDCSCEVFVPNAFTPNADTHNDVFRVRLDCPVRGYALSVFSRYGNGVFTSNNPAEAWDGTYKGKTCDVGVYYYMLSIEDAWGNKIFRKGDITLIR